MPTYEFRCRKCGRKFSETMTIGEHGKRKVKCPRCGSGSAQQTISVFSVETSKKS